MSLIDLKNAAIYKLMGGTDNVKLWAVNKLPPNTGLSYNLHIALAEPNYTITDLERVWLENAGLTPKRTKKERQQQFEYVIYDFDNDVLIVENAHYLHKATFTDIFLMVEKYGLGVILVGDILEIGGKIFDNMRFLQRAHIGIYDDEYF